ncbi:hypothetical protein [Gemmata obscuriglobus]|uniref:hypothetical protein n=1 Tax=Gemmata obscuriglobus TaxID=114 RepID=UPI001E65C37B|nr:hypothetical protein [Gemmata obscuriglobus]
MNETEWLTAREPWGMIAFIRESASRRKLRLFACACCRQVLNPFAPPLVERAVTAAEMFADGEVGHSALLQTRAVVAPASNAARRANVGSRVGYLCHLWDACLAACWDGWEADAADDAALATARAAADVPWPATGTPPADFYAELANQADLLRDIFGNPFTSCGLEPEWLTDTVIGMARSIYTEYTFDQLPVLADALQDAGCDSDPILNHCRSEREHVRGCWVVDLLLSKA